MAISKKYNNPPLVEAVFEMFFTSSAWSSIIPGLFYNEIKEKYPIITQNQGGFGIAFDNKSLNIGPSNNQLTQYKNNSGDTIIQLAGNLLTVNKLPKYTGWESYLETIIFAVETLKRVIRIDRIDRIGLKAINKIDIKINSIEQLKKYINIYPNISSNPNIEVSSIQINLESQIIENTEVCSILVGTLRKEPNYEAPILFQIYVTRINTIPEDYKSWVEHAHTQLSETFESSLTQFCKDECDKVL